ncbi:MAG: LysM peptidoglycan-binding domain-containing protein [Pseudobdellovibrionaceae bacterium]
MFKKVLISSLVCFLAACAHKSPGTDSAATKLYKDDGSIQAEDNKSSTSGLPSPDKDITSFRLKEEESKKEIVDKELESIPTEVNPLVEKWINYFTGRGSQHMERYLARSTRYEKLMKKVLRDNGLPEDLFYIALIESGFSSKATSHASAVGYWQFIRGTGKRYGLEINALVDERRDPVVATQAAADYFKGLYSIFGSWYLAMASYNVGENRVKREVMRHYTRDFWELARKKRLPAETINYVPKYIAAKLIAKDPAKYGFGDIDYLQPIEFDQITVKQPTNLRLMAEKMNLNYEDFKALNPKFKGEIASFKKNESNFTLRIPPGTNEAALVAANDSVAEKVQYIADTGDTQVYKIKRNDSLYTVARKFRTTVAYLRDLNDIPRGKKLRLGMKIYVPDRTPVKERKSSTLVASQAKSANGAGDSVSKKEVVTGANAETTVKVSNGAKYYIVQNGDSLFTIAQRYATSVQELKKLNKLRRGHLIRAGVKLKVPQTAKADEESSAEENSKGSVGSGMRSPASKKKFHVVRRGESLNHIAQRYRISAQNIQNKNKISNPSRLLVGSRLLIPEARAR